MSRKHMFLMVLCCLVPIAGLGAIFLFQIPINTLLFIGLLLVCLISHVLMMLFLDRDHDSAIKGSDPSAHG